MIKDSKWALLVTIFPKSSPFDCNFHNRSSISPMEAPQVESEDSASQALLTVRAPDDTALSLSLHWLETFLRVFGFCQYSTLSLTLSWVSFLLLGVALPLVVIQLTACSDCGKYQVKNFELWILASHSLVAAVSFLCVSHNLRKYGVRNFLFVDRLHGHMALFREHYIHKINGFFYLLGVWVLPCLLLKAVREVVRAVYLPRPSLWQSAALLLCLLLSWAYSTTIFLAGSALFNLICNLQVIHLDNFGKLLERDLDELVYIEEHIRLAHHLSKISHRFRIFLLIEFLVVTASQFVFLLQTTGNKGIINIINGGDFAASSIVELVGIIICLNAAAKISHRAQGIASVACRWHALATCNSNRICGSVGSSSASDVEEAVEYDTQLASQYHKRQALVMYLQTNPGGATIFGWTIDRGLINTIFFIELSLVLFVLGKTITFTTN